jgi:hypothetical protein
MPTTPTSPVNGRLLSHPFASQVASIKRTRATDPLRLVQWFSHWENNLPKFQAEYQEVNEETRSELLNLQSCFESIVERPFLGKTAITETVAVTPMNEAFVTMGHLVKAICRGHGNGLMVVGPGGTGKSYTTLQTLAQENKREGTDFVRIPGYSTPLAMYNNLYTHNGKIVVFDDCDSVFKDLTGLNVLKSVLDTLPTRLVAWNSTGGRALVPEFEFTGKVIFLSNMDPATTKDLNFKALLTRVFTLVISSSKAEILMRMVSILPSVAPDLTTEAREDILKFLQENYERFNDFSLRFLVNLVHLRKYSTEHWKDLALKLR